VGVRAAGEERRASLVVACDGSHSPLRRQMGLDVPPGRSRFGLRMHFRLAPGRPLPEWVDIYLGPGHELYVTPVGPGEVQVAALAWRGWPAGDARRALAAAIAEQEELAQLLEDAEPAGVPLGMAPLAARASRRVAPGLVLLGDAAGFQDPLTGGGMTQALVSSGMLAGRLRARFAADEAHLTAFDRERERMLRDYRRVTAVLLAAASRPWALPLLVQLMRAMPAVTSHAVGVCGGMRRLLSGAPPVKSPQEGPSVA